MEGIAALSFACNVVQVIGYGATAIDVIMQVYRDGRTVDNTIIESTTRNLQDSLKEIDSQIKSTTLENQLRQTVQQSTAVAAELIQELSKLKGSGSTWTKLKTGMASVKRKSKIEKLRQQLKDCERVVDTVILATLREQNEAAKIVREKSFRDLNSTLQTFIVRLSQGQTQAAELVKAENETTRALVVQTRDVLSSKIDSLEASKHRTRLLDSLRCPEIHARFSTIEDASDGTFDPIFKSSNQHLLYKWYSEGSGVLWIQGKAGSGKSTLMKFIIQSKNVADIISQRAPKVAVLKHFFWLSGAPLQRNLYGLLYSLAYQLVELVDEIQLEGKLYTSDWSTKELETLALSSLKSLAIDTSVFILLDALDEYDEQCDRRRLLKFINELSNYAYVCVSSRPESFWVKHLQHSSCVKLEDVNGSAIRTYVRRELEGLELTELTNLSSELTDRAEGVFLWAHIAVRDVLRGLDSNATQKELRQRIERLPRGMENLYKEMLGRVQEDWPLVQQEAALYFSTALLLERAPGIGRLSVDGSSGFLYQYYAAMNILSENQRNDGDFETFERNCIRLKDRIAFVCAGMLEVKDLSNLNHLKSKTVKLKGVIFERVRLTHRTVRDFILDVPFGRRLLSLDAWDPASVVSELIQVERSIYGFRLRTFTWDTIREILKTILRIQIVLNLDDSDCLRMILSIRELLQFLLPSQSQLVCQPIEFLDRQRIFSSQLRDWGFSMDFLGLTLECGTMCYFNSLGLAPEDLTLDYREYILHCVATSYRRGRPLEWLRSISQNIWNIFSSWGVSGRREFWLENISLGQIAMVCGSTTNKLLVFHALRVASMGKGDLAANVLQQLEASKIEFTDSYSIFLNPLDPFVDNERTLDGVSERGVAIYVEGSLKFWLSYLQTRFGTSLLQSQSRHIGNYQAAVPFRQLRFVMHRGSKRGVPMNMSCQVAAGVENGETLLDIWEASMQRARNLKHPMFSFEDRTRLEAEAHRLMKNVSSQLQSDAEASHEIRNLLKYDTEFDTHLIDLEDYLVAEGVIRPETEVDNNIPVFKDGRF